MKEGKKVRKGLIIGAVILVITVVFGLLLMEEDQYGIPDSFDW